MDSGTGDGQILAPNAELTETEQHLVTCVLNGEQVDLKRKPIRAAVLRDLILETRPGWHLPPAGLRLNRAIIQGCLDLEGCTLTKPVLLWHSRLEGGGDRGAILVRDARIKRLGIHSCTVEGNIVADRVDAENGIFIGGGKVTGGLFIRGGIVGGALALEGTEIGDGKAAILAAGVRVSGPLIIRRAKVSGEIAIPRANLGAGIYAEETRIEHAGIALNAESSRISGDVLMSRAHIVGGIRFLNARIEGRLAAGDLVVDGVPEAIDARGISVSNGVNLERAKLRGSAIFDGAGIGKAFLAEGIDVDGGETAIGADVIDIGGNWEMPRARLVGQLRCPGAAIEGQLRLTEIRIFGSDLAIRADGARIRGGCFLSRSTLVGLVRLPAAEIGNQFRLRAATIKVESGAALLASGTSFRRDVELNQGFQTVGAVILDHAHIAGALDLKGSHLKSAVLARAGLPAGSASHSKAQAHGDEHALSLVDARIDRLIMPQRSDERPRGIVDLSRARAGSFEDYADAWPPPLESRSRASDGRDIDHLVLDGFTYGHLGNPAGARPSDGGHDHHARADDRVAARRIAWLEGQQECDLKDRFKPQAWVALAQRLAAQGYTEDSRAVMIGRHRRERRSRAMTTSARWQNRLLDWFALYGHNPWRTVLWMSVVVLLFSLIWAGAAQLCAEHECFDESVFVVSNRDSYSEDKYRQSYPGFHSLAYSFDVFVPFVDFGYETHWRPNVNFGPLVEIPLPALLDAPRTNAQTGFNLTVTLGGVLYLLYLLEAVLGIVLMSLAVTGFTGILKGAEK